MLPSVSSGVSASPVSKKTRVPSADEPTNWGIAFPLPVPFSPTEICSSEAPYAAGTRQASASEAATMPRAPIFRLPINRSPSGVLEGV
jgi:hypothetical protein